MNITNCRVYDLQESIVASGLPMLISYDADGFLNDAFSTLSDINSDGTNKHIGRMERLSNTPMGSGHGNALSGITVSMNITATVKWWEQFQRYHFKQIVSSMSTMHRLRKMVKEGTIQFHPSTSETVINEFTKMANDDTVTDEQLAYSCPMGIMLTARVTTNYLQLRTMLTQRSTHKLLEWHQFCDYVLNNLPLADKLLKGAIHEPKTTES